MRAYDTPKLPNRLAGAKSRNQTDSSLYYLKKAADGGYFYRDTKVIFVLRPYRSHPVFRAVMRQFNLPEG